MNLVSPLVGASHMADAKDGELALGKGLVNVWSAVLAPVAFVDP